MAWRALARRLSCYLRFPPLFPHRALAAFRAILVRWIGESFSAWRTNHRREELLSHPWDRNLKPPVIAIPYEAADAISVNPD